MGLAESVSSIAGVLASANELIIDVATVNQVRTLLDEAAEQLLKAQQQMHAIPASAMGGSYWGQQLSHHSTLAHDRLAETVEELRAGLDKYELAMQTVLHDTAGADDANGAVFRQGDAYVQSATTMPSTANG